MPLASMTKSARPSAMIASACRGRTGRQPPSVASCAASASTHSRPWSRPSRCAATNVRPPANFCRSISKNSAGSAEPNTASPVTEPAKAKPAASLGVRSTALRAVHVCVDDHSRIAFSQILPDERKQSATAFLKAAVADYKSLGVTVERVMTDNGSCYRSKDFAKACKKLKIKRIRTRPYTPEDQRKGRALHTDRIARMGLRTRLPNIRPARRRYAKMPPSLQLAPTSCQLGIQNPHQQPPYLHPRTTY